MAGGAQSAALGAGSPLLGRAAAAAAAAEGGRAGPTLEGLREAAAEALVAVGELERWVLEGAEGEGRPGSARASRVTRERLVRRAAHRAAAARGQLAALLAGCEILSGHEEGVQARLIDLEGARRRLLRQVKETSERLREQAELNRRLTRELGDREEALDGRGGELDAARARAREEALRAAELGARAGEAEEQAQELRAAMANLREENVELRAEAVAALDRRDAAEGALSGAERVAAKAQEQVGKHQAGIARLTADNLAFLTREKDLRRELEEARRERDESRAQDGPWFERVKADVEAQVEAHISRAEALEKELKGLRGEHTRRAAGREAELAEARAETAGLRGDVEGLRGELEAHRLREQQHQLRLLGAEGRASDLQTRVTELEEEGRALLTSVHIAQGEIAGREVALLEQRRAAAAEGVRAEQAEKSLSDCRARLTQTERDLRVQRGMNAEVMQLKQKMELRLLEAKVSMRSHDNGGGGGGGGDDSPHREAASEAAAEATSVEEEGAGGGEGGGGGEADDGRPGGGRTAPRDEGRGGGSELEAPRTPRGSKAGPAAVEETLSVPSEEGAAGGGAAPGAGEEAAAADAPPTSEKKAKKKRTRPNPAKRERLKAQAQAAAASTPAGARPGEPSGLERAIHAPPFVPQSPPARPQGRRRPAPPHLPLSHTVCSIV